MAITRSQHDTAHCSRLGSSVAKGLMLSISWVISAVRTARQQVTRDPLTYGQCFGGGWQRVHRLRTEALVSDLQKRITEAFEVFDHESNKTVDVREIGTIIRSLGCCPTEGELHDMLAEVEEEEPTGYIRFQKFFPMMTKVLLERRYRPIPEDILLRAFEVLDEKKKGFLTKDELIKYMTEEGEPFTQEEMEEMISASVDPDKNIVPYKEFTAVMVVEDY
ncbi:dynein regulatory complex protein 8 isoform X2 [Dendrobates tinctorius]|uniref:dynein regulatory complex protein 8 isoform X2 n=1 Tax=Dendrobates tinctorius TaxID=92724 RepID=UPI003CCA3CA5